MVYPIGKHTIEPFIRFLWIKKINGFSNLPKDKPFIFAVNHASFIDDFVVPFTVCKHINRYVHMYCNDKFLKNFLLRKLLEWTKIIPIRTYKSKEQKEINKKAFDVALKFLKNNEVVGIFPEGHRSKDGKLQKAYSGVAILALKSNVPVIPIGTIGTYNIWPKGKKLPSLKKCIVNIGKPLYFKSKNKEIITKKVMEEIAKLSKQKYKF